MLNKVMIIGRLGADPELRYAATGMAVCRFNLATDESYVDQSGQRQERTEWHRVVVFNKQAENCANYLHKGSLAYVEGSLSTNKWTDQQGQTRYTTEIKAQRVQFLDRKGERPTMPAEETYDRPQPRQQEERGESIFPSEVNRNSNFPPDSSGMDDIPF